MEDTTGHAKIYDSFSPQTNIQDIAQRVIDQEQLSFKDNVLKYKNRYVVSSEKEYKFYDAYASGSNIPPEQFWDKVKEILTAKNKHPLKKMVNNSQPLQVWLKIKPTNKKGG